MRCSRARRGLGYADLSKPGQSADDWRVSQRVVTTLFVVLGLAAALYALSFAVDDLLSGPDDPWFGLLVLAVAPVLLGMGDLLPALIYARDAAARTRAVSAPYWAACQGASLWLAAIAGGVYLAGWWLGALLGAVVGGVFA